MKAGIMMRFIHKGYTLVQEAVKVNYHYMVFDKNGRMVMHVPYDKPVTEEKAKEAIEFYISFTKVPKEAIDEMLKDDEE